MKNFLRKINLIRSFEFDIPITQEYFNDRLSQLTEPGKFGIFAMSFEAFSGSKKEYTGFVNDGHFKIRKRRKMFDITMNFATVEGNTFYNGNTLKINGEVNGFTPIFYPYYIFLIVFYTIFIIAYLASGGFGSHAFFPFLPFIFFHGLLMAGIPYIFMRASVKRMLREIEREFYFLTK